MKTCEIYVSGWSFSASTEVNMVEVTGGPPLTTLKGILQGLKPCFNKIHFSCPIQTHKVPSLIGIH